MMFNKYSVFLFLLTSCICFGNIGGALQVDRILAILLSPWLFSAIGKNGFGYARNIFKVLVLFYIYMALSYLWTPDKEEAVKEIVYFPVHFLLFTEIIVFARYARNPLKSLSGGWTVAILLCSIVAFWEITTGNHLSLAKEQGDVLNTGTVILQHMTASVTFNNYNSYVTVLCFSIPWIFHVVISNDRRLFEKIIAISVLLMSFITIIINASRGGVLTIVVMLAVYWLFSEKKRMKSILLMAIILLAGILLIRYGETITAVFVARTTAVESFSEESRLVIWMNALRALAHTLGFGVGIGGITEALRMVDPNGVLSPHNMFVELLVQYGIVITLVVIVFLWKLFKKSLKVERCRKVVLMMALITMPIYMIIDSGYLLGPHFYVLMATIYVFANYELIKTTDVSLKKSK